MATPPPPPPTNMVVMVTGGSGLVGQGIKANIDREANAAETWIFLTSKDGDLRDKEQTRAIFEKHRPTHVIHLAARVGGLFSNMKYRVEFWRENVAINDNVLHLSHEYAAARRTRCDMATWRQEAVPCHCRSRFARRAPSTRATTGCASRSSILRLTVTTSTAPWPQVRRQEGGFVSVDVHLSRQDDLPDRRDDDP